MSYHENPPYYLTAYGLAVKHGFRGTEKDWLEFLTAYGQAKAEGFKGTREEWLESLRGATFTPFLSDDGWLSWTNDKDLPNPEPVNLLDLAGILPGGIRKRIEFTILPNAWEKIEEPFNGYEYRFRLYDLSIKRYLVPSVVLAEGSLQTAKECGLCNTAVTYDGYAELKAVKVPKDIIRADCNLMNVGSYGRDLPIADAWNLGAVKGSDTVIIDPDGTMHAVVEHVIAAPDEAAADLANEIYGK